MKTTKIVLGLLVITSAFTSAIADSGAFVRYHIVTAPTSTNNNSSIQNVMSYVDKDGVVGLIPTDITAIPAALNMPHILRASEIIYGPTDLKMWDTVADPAGAFANENGQRLAWSLDYTNTVPFLASDIYFRIWSSDAANTLRFNGNIATNGTTALVFSPTLRGELWGENGSKVATYYDGETVADHPVNRVMALIRLGYYVADMSQVQLDLDYFRNQMPLTNFVAFYTLSEWGITNSVTSRPYLTAHPVNNDGDKIITLEGQRRIGLTYGLLQSPVMGTNEVWTVVAGRMIDGAAYVSTLMPDAFFRAFEEGINLPPIGGGYAQRSATKYVPVLRVQNGPE